MLFSVLDNGVAWRISRDAVFENAEVLMGNFNRYWAIRIK